MLSHSIAGGHYSRMRRAQDIDEAGIRYHISEQSRNVCHYSDWELFGPRKYIGFKPKHCKATDSSYQDNNVKHNIAKHSIEYKHRKA